MQSADYTHRLLDFELLEENRADVDRWLAAYLSRSVESDTAETPPKVVEYLRREGLLKEIPEDNTPPKDVTTASIAFPSCRSERLQVLTRGQTGAVTALGYASLRGFGDGALHPTVGRTQGRHAACQRSKSLRRGLGGSGG